jgi:hypothetical protein
MTNIDWINAVAGKPWQDRAAGPNSYDCWGLVLDSFARIDGVQMGETPGYIEGEPIETAGNGMRDTLGWPEVPLATDKAVFCVYLSNGAMVHVGRILNIHKVGLFAVHAAGKNGVGQVTAEPVRQLQQRYGDRLKYYVRPNG